MNMTRRGFLGTCLALGAAPAIVRAESLMKAPVRNGLLRGTIGRYDGFNFVVGTDSIITPSETGDYIVIMRPDWSKQLAEEVDRNFFQFMSGHRWTPAQLQRRA